MVTTSNKAKCIWKEVTDMFGKALPDEDLRKCMNQCDGYRVGCENYLSRGQYEDEYNR